jgi:hypothetical protein
MSFKMIIARIDRFLDRLLVVRAALARVRVRSR